MMENYQQWVQYTQPQVTQTTVATISTVRSTVSPPLALIQFSDGTSGKKYYRLPPGPVWKAGMRVRLSYSGGALVIAHFT